MDIFTTILLRFESFREKVRINRYVFAFLSLAIGVALQFFLNGLTHQINFRILVISIFIAGWYGGFLPSIIVTIIGFLIADYFFIPPVYTLFPNPTEYVAAIIFVTEGILFGIVGESRKRWEKERKRAFEAEHKARQEAEEASLIRDDFISMASHELKSPITSQKLYIQALEKRMKARKDTESEKYLSQINTQIDRMVSLINDLLNVARIRAGKFILNPDLFVLADCVREVVAEFQVANPDYTIMVKGKSTKLIYADKERIIQVINNLLSNSIKYSPHVKQVAVLLSENSKYIEVGIKDYGIGISKANQKKLFTKYFRVEGTSEQKYKGFGMGLFIVSEIIKMHKGKVWVKSKEGKGSTFFFRLPVAKERKIIKDKALEVSTE